MKKSFQFRIQAFTNHLSRIYNLGMRWMRFGLFFAFFYSTFDSALAQNIKNPKDLLTKKEKHEVELADKYYDNQEYYLAAQEYEKAISANPNNKYALFQLAESYRLFFNYNKGEEYYKKTTQVASQE